MTPAEVRDRLVEAFEIERRIPSKTFVGVSTWPFPVSHSFADRVGWSDASERIWRQWEAGRGAAPDEITRMDEAFAWLRLILDYRDEHRCLAGWALLRAHHKPLVLLQRRTHYSRTTIHRYAHRGSDRIARYLNAQT